MFKFTPKKKQPRFAKAGSVRYRGTVSHLRNAERLAAANGSGYSANVQAFFDRVEADGGEVVNKAAYQTLYTNLAGEGTNHSGTDLWSSGAGNYNGAFVWTPGARKVDGGGLITKYYCFGPNADCDATAFVATTKADEDAAINDMPTASFDEDDGQGAFYVEDGASLMDSEGGGWVFGIYPRYQSPSNGGTTLYPQWIRMGSTVVSGAIGVADTTSFFSNDMYAKYGRSMNGSYYGDAQVYNPTYGYAADTWSTVTVDLRAGGSRKVNAQIEDHWTLHTGLATADHSPNNYSTQLTSQKPFGFFCEATTSTTEPFTWNDRVANVGSATGAMKWGMVAYISRDGDGAMLAHDDCMDYLGL